MNTDQTICEIYDIVGALNEDKDRGELLQALERARKFSDDYTKQVLDGWVLSIENGVNIKNVTKDAVVWCEQMMDEFMENA